MYCLPVLQVVMDTPMQGYELVVEDNDYSGSLAADGYVAFFK